MVGLPGTGAKEGLEIPIKQLLNLHTTGIALDPRLVSQSRTPGYVRWIVNESNSTAILVRPTNRHGLFVNGVPARPRYREILTVV